jgi:hypothetical protein
MFSMSSSRIASCTAALLALAAGAVGCAKAGGTSCPTGVYCPAGWSCAASEATCIQGLCGNGHRDGGEACDDGGTTNGRDHGEPLRCSADCSSNEGCGNEIWDRAALEVCDPSSPEWNPSSPEWAGGMCAADCSSTLSCGNGDVNDGEDCDGGPSGIANEAHETPVCNTNCKWSRCGDGIQNVTAGEQCDRNGDGVPGTNGQSATCNPDCTVTVCGDIFINGDAVPPEECDLGAGRNLASSNCVPGCKNNECGDGFRNLTSGSRYEECDAGPDNSDTGACTSLCKNARCGDTLVRTGFETCDEGAGSVPRKTECPYGQRPCTVCSECQEIALTGGPYCGDGTRQAAFEACDRGAQNGETTCPYNQQDCTVCTGQCAEVPGLSGGSCGDGVRQRDFEQCDDGNTVTEQSCPYGEANCTRCSSDCQVSLTLTGPSCGDGRVDSASGEVCDSPASFACGTCGPKDSANACRQINRQPAEGMLAIDGTDLLGIRFTLGDNSAAGTKVFEFVAGTTADGGRVPVSLAEEVAGQALTAAQIAVRVAQAINGASLAVSASVQSGATVVDLVNVSEGLIGNLDIVVDDPGGTGLLQSTGMDLGTGCSLGSACSREEDCLTVLTCSGSGSSRSCRR